MNKYRMGYLQALDVLGQKWPPFLVAVFSNVYAEPSN